MQHQSSDLQIAKQSMRRFLPVVFIASTLMLFWTEITYAQIETLNPNDLISQRDVNAHRLDSRSHAVHLRSLTSELPNLDDLGLDKMNFGANLLAVYDIPRAIESNLQLPDLQGDVGDIVQLSLRLSNAGQQLARLQSLNVIGFKAVVSFKSSILAVGSSAEAGRIDDGIHRITVEDHEYIKNGGGAVLFSLPLRVTLGDTDEAPIRLDHFAWITPVGELSFASYAFNDGRISIPDFWRWDDGSIRSVSAIEAANITISPNPVLDQSTIVVDNIRGKEASLRVFNLRGQIVLDLSHRIPSDAATVSIDLVRNQLPSGTYYCRVKTGVVSAVQVMVFE